MATDAEKVDLGIVDIQRHFSNSLGCIGMEENSSCPANLADFFHWLNDPNFIVNEDSAYTKHLLFWLIDGLLEKLKVNNPIGLDGQISDFEPLQL